MPYPFRDGRKIAVIIDLLPYSLAEKIETYKLRDVPLKGNRFDIKLPGPFFMHG